MNICPLPPTAWAGSFNQAGFDQASFSQASFNNDIRQVFDRLLDGSLFSQRDSDDSSVVTSRWVPRVDAKGEGDPFVLHADLLGIASADIEFSLDKGILSIKGERSSETSVEIDRFARIGRRSGASIAASHCPTARIRRHPGGYNSVLELSIPKRPESSPRWIRWAATMASEPTAAQPTAAQMLAPGARDPANGRLRSRRRPRANSRRLGRVR